MSPLNLSQSIDSVRLDPSRLPVGVVSKQVNLVIILVFIRVGLPQFRVERT